MTRSFFLAVWRVVPWRRVAPAMGLSLVISCLMLPASRDAAAAGTIKEHIRCLALTIYFEARGEPDTGKLAVGHVVMNRVGDPRFPDTVCGVVRQGGEAVLHRCQFSWWCDGRSDEPTHARAWRHSQALARRVFWQYSDDPTRGALWYHANYVEPDWRGKFKRGPRIGEHVFYLDPAGSGGDRPQIAQSP